MSKSILMSIQPKWVCEILNGNKTIEVRKKFPKGFVGWVYIYCSKDNKRDLYFDEQFDDAYFKNPKDHQTAYEFSLEMKPLNGKVVARFWCDKVEEHRPFFHWCIEKETCLSRNEVLDYLDSKNEYSAKRHSSVYAIHISKLEIFDKPKELKDFKPYQTQLDIKRLKNWGLTDNDIKSCKLVKAPQSWCYIEGEKNGNSY